MSNGVLCFANNNGKVDYLKQAIFLARRVKKHLGVPISLATANKRDFDYMYSDQRDLFDKISRWWKVYHNKRVNFLCW